MSAEQVQEERIRRLNDRPAVPGDYVLYWMQQSQRADYNHALEHAVGRAEELNKPLVACFGITDRYPEANLRHYAFLLEGLTETQRLLARRAVKMVIRRGPPEEVARELGRRAAFLVCDCGYLRHQKAWRAHVAREVPCGVEQVESDVVVPVEAASDKREYAARTLRPKIHRHLPKYLVEPERGIPYKSSLALPIAGLEAEQLEDWASWRNFPADPSLKTVSSFFRGGASAARAAFEEFLRGRFSRYAANRNQPQTDDVSHMSLYLHFGQISPLELALRLTRLPSSLQEGRDAYLEELIVRRELAANFVHFTPDYDAFSCLPDWARRTLDAHSKDPRNPLYGPEQLEKAQTHDPYWNAAMVEMKVTGYMHNFMRMYWGKKILEWSSSPEIAYRTLLALNNRYFIDGRDPNSYANAGWIFGLHDRPWGGRSVYGNVRSMSAAGLERKCDIDAYVRKVERLARESGECACG